MAGDDTDESIFEEYQEFLQVKWAADNLDGYLNFYSVSGDGRVSNWTIVKTALWTNDTLLINFCKTLSNLGEESVTELLMGRYLESTRRSNK